MDQTLQDKQAQIIKEWLGAGSINIFGMPFAGKDTQAKRLATVLGAPVIGGGDILRNHPDQETIQPLSASGQLFPSDFYLGIVLPYLSKQEFTDTPLVLSSVGRWSGEEEVILEATREAGHPTKAVVFIRFTEEEVRRRFHASKEQQDRGLRDDDAEHLIDVRIDEFDKKTRPVIEFYRKKGLVVDVDGLGTPEIVAAHIVEGLSAFAGNHGS